MLFVCLRKTPLWLTFKEELNYSFRKTEELVKVYKIEDEGRVKEIIIEVYKNISKAIQELKKDFRVYYVVNGYEIKWTRETDPSRVPWGENEVDVVIESTGRFRARSEVQAHLDGGAKRVLISAPGKDCPMIVPGVNMESVDREEKIFSLASCTTNCLAPVMKVLNDSFKVKRGFMTTTHAYTSDQRILDGSHKDLRRARAAAVSIIPTSTGAAKAIGKVIPDLEGKMDGFALRVPVVDGSITDITVEVENPATREEVNAKFREAAEGPLKGILQYSEEPLVSVDIIGNPHSSIVDSEFTKVSGDLVKVVSWYDNEYGYSNRLIDFIKYMKNW